MAISNWKFKKPNTYMSIKNMKYLWTDLTYMCNTCILIMKILLRYTKEDQNRDIFYGHVLKDQYC